MTAKPPPKPPVKPAPAKPAPAVPANAPAKSAATKSKKFQAWHLEGRGKIVGDWPLPDNLEPSQYVELITDAAGNLVEIREQVEGHKDLLVRKPKIEKGRIIQSEYVDPSTGLAGTNSYEYDSRGFLCARQEVNPKGALRFRIEVQCDDEGRIVRQLLHDHRRRLKERVDYRYDARGRRERDTFFKDKEGTQQTGWVERTHDDKGRVTKQAWYGADKKLLNTFGYEHDALDRVIEMRIERDGVTSVVSKFNFDDSGKRVSTVFSDDAGGTQGAAASPRTLSEEEIAARAGLSEAGGVDPKDIDAVTHAAYFFFEKGQLDRARELFETLASVRPDDPYLSAGVAAVAMAQGKHQTAVNWYDRALLRDEDHVQALAGRAEALLQLGRVDDALASFTRLFEVAPKDSNDPAVARARAILTGLKGALSKKKS